MKGIFSLTILQAYEARIRLALVDNQVVIYLKQILVLKRDFSQLHCVRYLFMGLMIIGYKLCPYLEKSSQNYDGIILPFLKAPN